MKLEPCFTKNANSIALFYLAWFTSSCFRLASRPNLADSLERQKAINITQCSLPSRNGMLKIFGKTNSLKPVIFSLLLVSSDFYLTRSNTFSHLNHPQSGNHTGKGHANVAVPANRRRYSPSVLGSHRVLIVGRAGCDRLVWDLIAVHAQGLHARIWTKEKVRGRSDIRASLLERIKPKDIINCGPSPSISFSQARPGCGAIRYKQGHGGAHWDTPRDGVSFNLLTVRVQGCEDGQGLGG
ncbi:hypothetical protein RRG08_018979 [Elysia crispata]|uniref:Uncharacterized protein n=1 Tax=Elysia crispata TaxID=231223 RepID=A0AAE1A5K0_9GAST|nr:hypothetical protein RRG08_018979 [Elysia crispata]